MQQRNNYYRTSVPLCEKLIFNMHLFMFKFLFVSGRNTDQNIYSRNEWITSCTATFHKSIPSIEDKIIQKLLTTPMHWPNPVATWSSSKWTPIILTWITFTKTDDSYSMIQKAYPWASGKWVNWQIRLPFQDTSDHFSLLQVQVNSIVGWTSCDDCTSS